MKYNLHEWSLHEKNVQVQAEELNKEGKCYFGRNKTEINEMHLETRSDLLIKIHFQKINYGFKHFKEESILKSV